MTDREKILSAIRNANLGPGTVKPAQDPAHFLDYEQPLEQACRMVEAVGGEVVRYEGPAGHEGEAGVRELVERIRPGCEVFFALNRGLEDFELRPVEVLVVKGSFIVAENGSVWINAGQPASSSHRSLLFLAEHLFLVLDSDQVVNNMHEACNRIRAEKCSYGTFVSGPSKTADIEQALVIGAQGPRRMTLIVT